MQRDQTEPDVSMADVPSTIHFVETAPSMLREMPWIQLKDSKVGGSGTKGVWSLSCDLCA